MYFLTSQLRSLYGPLRFLFSQIIHNEVENTGETGNYHFALIRCP
jgi:hypothetical protein